MVSISAGCVALMLLLGQATERGVDVAPEAIELAIERLGASEFQIRQRATQFLWECGPAIGGPLRQALENSRDNEVRLRIQSILDDFEYGVFADTPPEVARLVRRYRRGDLNERGRLWNELVGSAPLETLLAIAELDEGGAFKLRVLERLEGERETDTALQLADRWRASAGPRDIPKFDAFVRRQLPHLLVARQFDRARRILEQSATSDDGIRHWAVFVLLRGLHEQEVQDLRTRIEEASRIDQRQALDFHKLAHLLRVKGEVGAAKEVAKDLVGRLRANEQAGRNDTLMAAEQLLKSLLFDARDWPALAQIQQRRLEIFGEDPEELGFAAAYYRLAGEQESFRRTVDRIQRVADKSSRDELEYCREAFFLNGQTDRALRVLIEHHESADAFQIQLVRQQLADAFQQAGIGLTHESREEWLQLAVEAIGERSPNSSKQFRVALQLAQTLHNAGEQNEAATMFARLADAAKDVRDAGLLRELAEHELKAGLTNEAFEHIAIAIRLTPNDYSAALGVLFSRHLEAANVWWEIFEVTQPAEDFRPRLARLRKLFYRGPVDDELVAQLTSALQMARTREQDDSRRASWLKAIGETCLVREQTALARECFEASVGESAAAAMHLADMSREARQWQAAATWYEQAWKLERKPEALYLQGLMLQQAGRDEEGREAIKLAELLPLASAARHDDLALGLSRRGYQQEAVDQWNLLRHCSTWSEAQMFGAIAGLGESARSEHPLEAAALWEQRMLNCLQKNWHFTEVGSYVRIPYLVHQTRAVGLFDEGSIDAGLEELRMCRQIWPGNAGTAEELVPRLDQAEQRKIADEVFEEAFTLLVESCNLFPNSALYHNNVAWLSARCDRRLDDALRHVERALEIVPDSAQYVDTLGEVYFRRGEVDRAIESARRCIELDPTTEFYRQQLARFLEAKQQPP